jgi:two-component system OmpR family sensor kinase
VTSVRRKLLVTLLLGVVVVSLVAMAATYRVARRQLDLVFDYQLQQMAHVMSDRAVAAQVAAASPPDADISVQITEGGVRMRVKPQGDAPPTPEVTELGFSDIPRPDGEVRVFAIRVGDAVVQVGQPLQVREEMAFRAAVKTLIPLAILLGLLVLLVWLVVRRGMQPLARLATAVTARTPAALEPVEEQGVPLEALPLVRSLNGLLARLQAAMAAQRAFVADAAHELRTPLAALKLQLQLAERASEGPERAAALSELAGGLERSTHLVQQLLTLARLDPGAGTPAARSAVDLAALVRQTVADHAVLAEHERIDLGAARVEEGVSVDGEPAALRTLLANLVDNALRHTPGGGRVDVSAGGGAEAPYLEVADSGPGIPAAERERVFDRFYRTPGSAEGGSGLGLSIVKAIAERHGATIELLETPGGGLTVRLVFRAAL